MTFLDFEKPIEALYSELEKTKQIAERSKVDMHEALHKIALKIKETRSHIYSNLTGWQRVQLSRHPDRPYSLDYIELISPDFIELFGDRCVKDDPAMVGGMGTIDGQTVMFIGQQKGRTTKLRQFRNFGMANPDGYRKALRLMRLAEKFNIPIVTLIDTPGAFPGLEAEERGQGEAIARNLFEMVKLTVPVVCFIIGEGASGGALGIGVGDSVMMLENTWYSVISPESCSSILWHTWDKKELAAEQLKLTADHMLSFGLIDGIVQEPEGGAHQQPTEMAVLLKNVILQQLAVHNKVSSAERIAARIAKFDKMGKEFIVVN
jgi:acetyl-CoA carboxylase carboxyl transferase subunit alpha